MRRILQPEWLIDGSGSPAQAGMAVIVEGDTIRQVGPAADVLFESGDEVIDLGGTTLIPGLINNHVHLVLPGDNTPFTPWIDLQSDASLALQALHNAELSLANGVTTVRDCGGRRTVVLDLRDAQRSGLASGARVVSCGWTLTITGGHTRQFGGEVDGMDGVARAVRAVVAKGADYVKVMAAGGGTPGSLPQYPSFTEAELRAIVETAHGLGKLVSAHCIATQSIVNAVNAGVDLIEHASFYAPDGTVQYDAAVAELLAKSNIPVTPTLQVNRDLVDMLPDGPERDTWKRRQEGQHETVRKLKELGVPLLAGSDAGWRATPFDTFWLELDELVESGLTPIEAIHAATGGVAKALRIDQEIGLIAAGLNADLVAVRGNAGERISCLSDVEMVIHNGDVVVEPVD